MRLDSKVWMTMLLVVVVCIGLVGYKKFSDETCIPFLISTKGLNSDNKGGYSIGEIIRFTATISNNKNIIWDFGDGSEEEKGSLVSHIYNNKGKYIITAKVNGKCFVTTSVYIRTAQVVRTYSPDTLINPATIIMGNETPEAHKAETYICSTPATSFEWTILNRNEYKNQNNKIATYTFRTQGSYIIQLKLDNDRGKIYTKTIYVQPPQITDKPLHAPVLIRKNRFPKINETTTGKKDSVILPPVANTNVPKTITEETKTLKTIGLPDEAFKSFLEDVVKGSKDVNFFNKYLNNGGDTKVRVNNERNTISFAELIQRIKGNKKITIKDVKVLRDTNKDVLQINIVYIEKGGILRFLKKKH